MSDRQNQDADTVFVSVWELDQPNLPLDKHTSQQHACSYSIKQCLSSVTNGFIKLIISSVLLMNSTIIPTLVSVFVPHTRNKVQCKAGTWTEADYCRSGVIPPVSPQLPSPSADSRNVVAPCKQPSPLPRSHLRFSQQDLSRCPRG